MPKEARNSTWLRELLGLCAFAAALLLVISLATYDPRDPAPFFKAGAAGGARNFIGPVGAFLAELLVPQLFGFAAIVLPLGLGLIGWKLFWCQPIKAPMTRVVGTVLLLTSSTGLLTMSLGTVTMRGEPVRTGGAVGELVAAALRASVSQWGAFIILT